MQTEYDFAEFNILAYVTSLLDILTRTLLAHTYNGSQRDIPMHFDDIISQNDNRLAVSFWRQSSTCARVLEVS